jgi:D-amino-acid dehydrogenase
LKTPHTLVIGAGITGITTAYFLHQAGHRVTVVDAERYPGMVTSYANGGQLSVSNSEVWTTWSNVGKGLRWMTQADAPLLVRPWPSLAKVGWMLGFLNNTMRGRYRANTEESIRIGLEARDLYFQIAADTGIEFDLSKRGILHFYRDQRYLRSADQACHIYQRLGVDRRVITAADVVKLEPTLANADGIVGGTWTPGDAMGDIHKFCNALGQWLVKQGVRFQHNARVVDAGFFRGHWEVDVRVDQDTDFIEANNVVICAGSRSTEVAKLFEERIRVYPVKGYSITIQSTVDSLPRTSLLDDQAKIVTSTLGDRLRVAGTAELDDWNLDIRADRIRPLIDWVQRTLPGVPTRDVRPWAGLRPMTPSMMPIVRAGRLPGVYLNTGHGHLGWTMSAATANRIVKEITNA